MDNEDSKTEAITLIIKKERFLSELIAWLKGKGMWEQAKKDLGVVSTVQEEGMPETIAERVKRIIAEQLGCRKVEVVDTARFAEDLGADSLDSIELVMAIEEEFNGDIPDEEAEKLITVGQAVKYVEDKIAAAKTSGGRDWRE